MTLRSDPRPWTLPVRTESGTRISVKRSCENCGALVGDVTEEELKLAFAGAPLPNVAEECGCARVVEQLAMLTQRADAYDNGTGPDGKMHPTWDELGEPGQEAYRAEALRTLRAVAHLGWGPIERIEKQIANGAPA